MMTSTPQVYSAPFLQVQGGYVYSAPAPVLSSGLVPTVTAVPVARQHAVPAASSLVPMHQFVPQVAPGIMYQHGTAVMASPTPTLGPQPVQANFAAVTTVGTQSPKSAPPQQSAQPQQIAQAEQSHMSTVSCPDRPILHVGAVVAFGHRRGYGFIDSPTAIAECGRQIFVHQSESRTVSSGCIVEFSIAHTKKGPLAKDLRILYNPKRQSDGASPAGRPSTAAPRAANEETPETDEPSQTSTPLTDDDDW
eukprot:TRINITY_DN5869_c0_g1_i4.p1 TRINITY_DN5869_c0_g1~~TRINITY_DN5869_c0_g1_i4.p1  ORF type:complete len:250 (+),score=49.14 TRINITY_DN5869_c0_g1_i4:98-847(+)